MKELSIEEKAKAYDEAKARMSRAFNSNRCTIGFMNEIFPELKESEDKEIREQIVYAINKLNVPGSEKNKLLAWMEKQGEKKPQRIISAEAKESLLHDKYEGLTDFERTLADTCIGWIGEEIGWKQYIKDNADVLLKIAVEKFNSVQDVPFEQKPTNKVEPKFKVGDYVVGKYISGYISEVRDDCYLLDYQGFSIDKQDNYHLWTIADAKEGDVLAAHECLALFKKLDGLNIKGYCTYHYMGFNPSFYVDTLQNKDAFHPATKEQRNLLFEKMKEAGYEWDAEKKELKKINNEEVNGEDYGIDSLWHAKNILEKTLGKVDGYQTDDGILEHKCAIAAVNKLYKQKKWSEEDEVYLNTTIAYLKDAKEFKKTAENCIDWLKKLKQRIGGKQ